MRRWLSGLAPRRRVLILALVAVALLGSGAIVVTTVTGTAITGTATAARLPTPTEQRGRFGGDRGTVILVPGYGGGRSSLGVLAEHIDATGRHAVVMALPAGGTGDLNLQAQALQKLAVRSLLHTSSIDVVGYSAGGVVIRLWIASYGGAAEVDHVITLGAPLHGATLATVGQVLAPGACPAACQQLVPGSLLLATVNASPIPGGVDWMSIWTTDDKIVDPPDSARLAGAVNVEAQSICAGVVISHGELPTNPLVIGLVLSALRTGEIRAPNASDCAALRRYGRR
jgi:triacylglycerol lipase